jgi:hypothetical protein
MAHMNQTWTFCDGSILNGGDSVRMVSAGNSNICRVLSGNQSLRIWLVVSIPLKNISQWEGLSHILWKIKMFETTNQVSMGEHSFIHRRTKVRSLLPRACRVN